MWHLQKIIQNLSVLSFLFGSCHPSNSEKAIADASLEEMMLTTEPESESESVDLFLKECGRQAWWDQYNLEKLGERSAQDRVTTFALFLYGEKREDPRDGEFIAKLLPLYKSSGWNYVALEADRRLTRYIGTSQLESKFRRMHREDHWLTYEPILRAAQRLGMNVTFYDQSLSDTDQRGEVDYSLTRGEAQFANIRRIFDRDPYARVITVGGIGHAFAEPVEKSFLEPSIVTPLGTLLGQYVGDSRITRVMLHPEDPSILSIHFDRSFYLAKRCPAGIEPIPPEIHPGLRKFGVFPQ